MVNFKKEKNIEIKEFSPDLTLKKLTDEIGKIDSDKLKCRMCGNCCYDNIPVLGFDIFFQNIIFQNSGIKYFNTDFKYLKFPHKPDMAQRQKSIREMMRLFGLSEPEAAVFYEYNNSEPVLLRKNEAGQCLLNKDRLCSMYETRPYICRLYQCKLGERLSYLKEMIVSQGIWHSYYMLGWIEKSEIKHNPFLTGNNYDEILLKLFDYDFENIQNKLRPLF